MFRQVWIPLRLLYLLRNVPRCLSVNTNNNTEYSSILYRFSPLRVRFYASNCQIEQETMALDNRDRDDFLNEMVWSAGESHIKYIEAWSFDGVGEFIYIQSRTVFH
jgi:hypothetical protein